MARNNLLAFYLLLLAAQLGMTLSQNPEEGMYPFNCSASISTCSAFLYHVNYANPSLSKDQIASYYSINSSASKPIRRSSRQDYLIQVPCSCQPVNLTTAYFYETNYMVQQNDSFPDVSNLIYSGQAFPVGGRLRPGRNFTMNLVCGCVQSDSDIVVVTYTVQNQDTLTGIASLLSATVNGIAEMNTRLLAGNLYNLRAGWVLYVPSEAT